MKSYIFPGQGSQSIGMCQDFFTKHPEYNIFFEQAEEKTNKPLRQYIWSNEEKDAMFFQQTDVIQPAIYTISCAMAEYAKNTIIDKADIIPVAGHSLGEYAAFFISGYITFQEGLSLLSLRSKAMQKICSQTESGMLACLFALGTEDTNSKAANLAKESGCEVANYNSPEQIVLSGYNTNIEKAIELSKKYEVFKTVKLNVAGAYHSSIFKSAAEEFAESIRDFSLNPKPNQKFKLFCNITGKEFDFDGTPTSVKKNMIEQIYSSVMWSQTINNIITDNPNVTFMEIGPGNVLTKMLSRQKISTINLEY